MNDFSVGDFAQKLLNQEGGNKPVPTTPSAPPVMESINEQQIDISRVAIPQNFLEVITEDKELELSTQNETLTEDKAEVAEENPVAGEAIDIIIEGLGKMLETVKETLNEVKEFVNEHSLVTELTSVGGIGVNMAPPEKKATPKSKLDQYQDKQVQKRTKKDDKKKDRLQQVLDKARGKKKAQR